MLYVHTCRVSKRGTLWFVDCSFNSRFFQRWFDTFELAIADADRHSWQGDDESRYCSQCEKYMPTCDDFCLYCETDT